MGHGIVGHLQALITHTLLLAAALPSTNQPFSTCGGLIFCAAVSTGFLFKPVGIDYTHPAFGSCTAINEPAGQCRVVAGKDLVGDEFVSGKDVQKPDNDPVSNYSLH
jgi:hypothetical protein